MGELRLQRLRYTIAGLIFAVLLRESGSLPWLEFNGGPLSALFGDGPWLQVTGLGFGGAFALWGLVPVERHWPLVVAVAAAAVAVFVVALNIFDPDGRAVVIPFGNVVVDRGEVTYAPGMLLAIVSSAGAFVIALWALRDDLDR